MEYFVREIWPCQQADVVEAVMEHIFNADVTERFLGSSQNKLLISALISVSDFCDYRVPLERQSDNFQSQYHLDHVRVTWRSRQPVPMRRPEEEQISHLVPEANQVGFPKSRELDEHLAG